MTLALAKAAGLLVAAVLTALHVAAAIFLLGMATGIYIALTIKGEAQ